MTKPSTRYTEAIGLEICESIAEGKTLSAICAADAMPNVRTALRWLKDNSDFAGLYDRARQARADAWAEEIIQIADDTSEDYVDKSRPDGSTARVLDAEHVQRSRLRIDSRKWLMAKAAPRKYGDRLNVDQTSEVTVKQDIDLSHLSKKEREIFSIMMAKIRAANERGDSVVSDPAILLDWMASRGPGDITMRAIGDTGPRSFRRKVDADPAIAALIEAGAIVEVSVRPLAFRVVGAEAAPGTSAASSLGLPSPEAIVVLLADEMADRRQSVPEAAAAYIASADVRSALMAQVREARGLPCSCEACEEIGREVDDAVMSALGCDVGE